MSSYMPLRRFFIASTLILSPLAAIGFESAAFAGTTQDINLGAVVPSRISITSTADANSSALQNLLNLTGSQTTTEAKIADLTVDTNENSVNISATSVNNGALLNSTNGQTIPYLLEITQDGAGRYGGSIVSDLNFQAADGDYDLHILIPSAGNIKAGTYTDILTLTVASGD